VVVSVILGQVELGGVHLAHRLLGLEELVEPPMLVLLNGREGVDSVAVASCVHFCVKGSVGSARPGKVDRLDILKLDKIGGL